MCTGRKRRNAIRHAPNVVRHGALATREAARLLPPSLCRRCHAPAHVSRVKGFRTTREHTHLAPAVHGCATRRPAWLHAQSEPFGSRDVPCVDPYSGICGHPSPRCRRICEISLSIFTNNAIHITNSLRDMTNTHAYRTAFHALPCAGQDATARAVDTFRQVDKYRRCQTPVLYSDMKRRVNAHQGCGRPGAPCPF